MKKYRATIVALVGDALLTVEVEHEDERFAAFLAIERLNDHPTGAYVDSYAIKMECLG